MKFGTTDIPERLFSLARERMAGKPCTPEQVRQHILANGRPELEATSSIGHNHRIIADRVFQATRAELVAAGMLVPIKRGLWGAANV